MVCMLIDQRNDAIKFSKLLLSGQWKNYHQVYDFLYICKNIFNVHLKDCCQGFENFQKSKGREGCTGSIL